MVQVVYSPLALYLMLFILTSHVRHILDFTCCITSFTSTVMTVFFSLLLVQSKKHTPGKALCSCVPRVLPVQAMDYLITIKPLWTELGIFQKINPSCLESPGSACTATKARTTHTELHTAYCPIMPWTQHNNLELNLDISVCQLKHYAAVCITLDVKQSF